jgi:protein-S-isoprenylcysteine O-methyltransferase Ste14
MAARLTLAEPPTGNAADTAGVAIRPPLAWGLAVVVGVLLDLVWPLPFLPAQPASGWFGAMVFVLALGLFAWSIATMTRAGSNVPTNLPTIAIVEEGPYRFTRNPIYLAMVLALLGLAMALDDLWLALVAIPFALVIQYGVVAREEVYLERKFGDVYLSYRSRVRRWF